MRRLLFAAAALLALLLGGSFLVWRWAEGRMFVSLAAWTAAAAAQGWVFRSEPPEQGGWPFAVALTLPHATLTAAATAAHPALAWGADALTLRVVWQQPDRLALLPDGTQTVTLGDRPPLRFTADRFAVTLPLPPDSLPTSLIVNATGLAFAQPWQGMAVATLEGSADWHAVPTGRLSVESVALPPPPAPQSPLGGHIASATMEGTLTGANEITLQHLAVGWGPLGVTGSATLGLDDARQPVGHAELRLVGYSDTLTALTASHALSAQTATAVRAVLALLAHTPEEGGTPTVELPLSLADGLLSMGHIRLAKVPKLIWPPAP